MDTIKRNPKNIRLSGVKLALLCILAITFAYGCDQACFDKCTTTNKNIKACGTQCGCPNEAMALNDKLKKNQRCYGECRHGCSFDLFKTGDTQGKIGQKDSDCFGTCTCICNRGCTTSCATSPNKSACLQGCGCPKDKNQSDALLAKSDKYFSNPLDPRTDDQISKEFQGKFVELISSRYKETEAKTKTYLDKRYGKLESKWNDYVSRANKIGVDLKVFCNTTCSHTCFEKVQNNDYQPLFGCLINDCKCFNPKLPKHQYGFSYEPLIALRQMIEEERISKVNQRIEKGLSYIPENVRSHIPIGHLSYHQEVGAAISDATTPQISDPLASPTSRVKKIFKQ